METRWNARPRRHPQYRDHDHALNLNIGKIRGGDWTSSVPAWCVFDVRMGLFPGQDLEQARQEVETVLQDAAQSDGFLRNNQPEIVYHGFHAEGYALAEDDSQIATQATTTLEAAHRNVTGTGLTRLACTATTDARFFGLYADTPALVYGPQAQAIHGFNERVDLASVRRLTKTTALFIANWCGLETV